MPHPVPLPVIALAYKVEDRTVRRWANNGRLGPVSTPPGYVRKRTADRAEVERRLGTLEDAAWSLAWAKYRHAEQTTADKSGDEA